MMKVALWGYGKYGRRMFESLTRFCSDEYEVVRVYDRDYQKLKYTDGEVSIPIYNPEALASYDKYAFFLHGNNGYSRIKGSGEGKILLIKDSFANCFVPFLTESYETTDVIDLRNYQYSPDSLIDSEKYDEILILYGLQTLFTDTSIINLNRPTTIKD